MNDIQKELDTAFNLLLKMLVNGDNVDIVASVKVHLRNAYTLSEGINIDKKSILNNKESKDG